MASIKSTPNCWTLQDKESERQNCIKKILTEFEDSGGGFLITTEGIGTYLLEEQHTEHISKRKDILCNFPAASVLRFYGSAW